MYNINLKKQLTSTKLIIMCNSIFYLSYKYRFNNKITL